MSLLFAWWREHEAQHLEHFKECTCPPVLAVRHRERAPKKVLPKIVAKLLFAPHRDLQAGSSTGILTLPSASSTSLRACALAEQSVLIYLTPRTQTHKPHQQNPTRPTLPLVSATWCARRNFLHLPQSPSAALLLITTPSSLSRENSPSA